MSKVLDGSAKPKEPFIWTKEMQDEAIRRAEESQAEEEMAKESMSALNQEQGLDANPLGTGLLAEKYDESLFQNGAVAEQLDEIGADMPVTHNPAFQGIGVKFVPDPEHSDVTVSEDTVESEIDSSEIVQESETPEYNNFFAKIVGGFANMVGPDTELGQKLSDLAADLDGKDVQESNFGSYMTGDGLQDPEHSDSPYHDLNQLDDETVEFTPINSAYENGAVSIVDENTNHYIGELGSFDYNTDEWEVAERTAVDSETGNESKSTVLRYVGDETDGKNIKIPEGVKNLDYAFENNKNLISAPEIPDSVESAFGAFKGCENVNDDLPGLINMARDLHENKNKTEETELRQHITESNREFMSGEAKSQVLAGGFLEAGKDGADLSSVQDMMLDMRKELDADTLEQTVGYDAWEDGSPQKQHAADTHMGMMRGLSVYNDTAKEQIENFYKDSPDKKEQALKGLDRTMNVMVSTAYDTIYENNDQFEFLSDSDKKELDGMKFEGIEMKYSDYEAKRNGPDVSDEMEMYGNAGIDDELDTGSGEKPGLGEVYDAVTGKDAIRDNIAHHMDQARKRADLVSGKLSPGEAYDVLTGKDAKRDQFSRRMNRGLDRGELAEKLLGNVMGKEEPENPTVSL